MQEALETALALINATGEKMDADIISLGTAVGQNQGHLQEIAGVLQTVASGLKSPVAIKLDDKAVAQLAASVDIPASIQIGDKQLEEIIKSLEAGAMQPMVELESTIGETTSKIAQGFVTLNSSVEKLDATNKALLDNVVKGNSMGLTALEKLRQTMLYSEALATNKKVVNKDGDLTLAELTFSDKAIDFVGDVGKVALGAGVAIIAYEGGRAVYDWATSDSDVAVDMG